MSDVEDPEMHQVTTGSWRDDPILAQARLPPGTNTTARAKAQREYLVKYVACWLPGRIHAMMKWCDMILTSLMRYGT